MLGKVVQFLTLLSAALLVGAMCAVWLEGDPGAADPRFYIQFQQHRIGALNTIMPLMGAACLLLTIASAILERRTRARAIPISLAIPCLIAAALITRFLNQPINAQVMTWSADSLPLNWALLRSDWWLWHDVRTLCALAALAALIIATLIERPRPALAAASPRPAPTPPPRASTRAAAPAHRARTPEMRPDPAPTAARRA